LVHEGGHARCPRRGADSSNLVYQWVALDGSVCIDHLAGPCTTGPHVCIVGYLRDFNFGKPKIVTSKQEL
jgi:hypothetical protein